MTPELFDAYFQSETDKGQNLYRRVCTSAMDAVVDVLDQGQTKRCIMLGSNNYLGFANHPAIKEAVALAINTFGIGVSGPPLLNGNSALHHELESQLAALKGKEDALLFASGYQANVGLVDGLLSAGDVFIYDESSHASLIDGLKLARATRRIKSFHFAHNNLDDLRARLLEACVRKGEEGHIYVAVEGVYSMDGDIAPLVEIVELCETFGARLILDDAHGTGVLGTNGGGTCEHFGLADRCFLIMGTFSKVFAMTGGFVCGDRAIINYLRFFSRASIFSAHLPITTVAAVLAGLALLKSEPERRERCLNNARYLKEGFLRLGFSITSTTPILPIQVSAGVSIRALNRRLFDEGLFVNAIEYPAVPLDAQRLRLSVSSDHTQAMLDQTLAIFETCLAEGSDK